jgi:pimeloyl-ACP methyl ester carboxylesterase
LSRLVLVDTLGLVAFEPAPEFGRAMNAFLSGPTNDTHDQLWRYCAHRLDELRGGLADQWPRFRAYNVDRAGTPSVQAAVGALMAEFGGPPVPASVLDGIDVPTSLVWGRYDLATPLRAAQDAGTRRGWPLHIVEDCGDDPAVEAPEAFLRALRTAISAAGATGPSGAAGLTSPAGAVGPTGSGVRS